MALTDLVLPKLGESIMEATILKWHKSPGDAVQLDETVLEIATDKVDSEVPSTSEGILEEILYNENDVVPIGAVIARIRTADDSSAESQQPAVQEKAPETVDFLTPEAENIQAEQQPAGRPTAINTGRFYSPLVLNIAANEGISMSELEAIPGTGNDGRVTKKDILQYVADRKTAAGPVQKQLKPQPPQQLNVIERTENENVPQQFFGDNVEIIEMDRMRKLIAKHMVNSKQTSPHVTSFTEADVTNLVLWRNKVKKEFEKRENEKITFTPLFIEAVVKCIKKYPWLNSSLHQDNIIVKKDINIGMATALPSGNLIVPVIKNADQLNLVGLTKKVNALANAARNNKLLPDDTTGGSFTITNVGTFGSLMGTPIINQPQVAILAVGAIKKRPVVIETEQGDSIAIRHMMYLSLSYDHRIIDGALGATFLNAIAKELENFNPGREF